MAQVGGKVTYVLNTALGVKECLVTFTSMTTGDVITMSSGTQYSMSTIIAVSPGSFGGANTYTPASVVVASNVASVNGTSGVSSGYAWITGF